MQLFTLNHDSNICQDICLLHGDTSKQSEDELEHTVKATIGHTLEVNENYRQRIDQVCNYIYAHLDEELTVAELSKVAHFSKYHFHRQFCHYMGINVFKFVQQLRLKRAAYQLVFHHKTRIIDIALDAKFEYPESFARAFKKEFGQSPSEFRNQPNWLHWNQQYHHRERALERHMKVDIIFFEETNVAVKEHRAAPERVNESASQFIEWRKSTGLSPIASSRTFGIIYDDPKVTAPEDFRFDICGEIKQAIGTTTHGIINKTLPAGRCAVIRHHGSHDDLDSKVHYLYGQWLPESDEELRDFPCFFHYLNFFPEVAEHELITDIYLPLK
ncbi:AraC family transcriptional regulator [Photobacterium alginatilyticum]|uniref:Helix-turn-helix domain-containing protein n=1 Tax=Photobacterium alginatilyticum TaxID=1775171 RepID=A0ABW9YGZ0_9GAMM|nr:AraC family transcriptional regulator [Photobacterium alginatilyticum]NBI52970.1 helix-turn-helix domain-containing protein [Photobacterium alginatilyticum]